MLKELYLLWLRLAAPQDLHYINGADTLPPPLPPEQERAALDALTRGQPQARDLLITHNLRLVVYIAKKFETPTAGLEDMISIGTIGLIKAVNTFEPTKNIKLATYASRCIGNEILMYLRKSSNRRQDASIDEPLNTDGDGNELLLMDVLTSDDTQVGEQLERSAERAALRGAVGRLSPGAAHHGAALRPGGRHEHTQKEVADALGITQSYISRLEKRIIRRCAGAGQWEKNNGCPSQEPPRIVLCPQAILPVKINSRGRLDVQQSASCARRHEHRAKLRADEPAVLSEVRLLPRKAQRQLPRPRTTPPYAMPRPAGTKSAAVLPPILPVNKNWGSGMSRSLRWIPRATCGWCSAWCSGLPSAAKIWTTCFRWGASG